MQEERDVLSLEIAKYQDSTINLPEYEAVMVASLRSLVPKIGIRSTKLHGLGFGTMWRGC